MYKLFCVLLQNKKQNNVNLKSMNIMKRNIRLFLCLCALVFAAAVSAQTMKYQDLYKVKKKDTISGLAEIS